jgi:hypothetical protein
VVKTGTRVRVRQEPSGSLFSGKTGTVVHLHEPQWTWDVWVRLDNQILNNYVYGFMERELKEIPADSTESLP